MTTAAIPTDPSAYNVAAVRSELQTIQNLRPKLALYSEREFRELPKQLQEQVRSLKTITQPTSSGLEHIENLLWQLAAVESLLQSLANGESIAGQLESLAKPVSERAFRITPEPDQVQQPVSPEPVDGLPAAPTIAPKVASTPVSTAGGTLNLGTQPQKPISAAPRSGGPTITFGPAKPAPKPSGGTLALPSDKG